MKKPKLKPNLLRKKAKRYFRYHPPNQEPFDCPYLTEQLDLDPTNRTQVQKVYQNVIQYWRDKAIPIYEYLKQNNSLDSGDKYQNWQIFLQNYNKIYGAYFFLYDRKQGYYIQPNFAELEQMSNKRIEWQWKGIKSIMGEMVEFDERMLPSGRRAQEALKDIIKYGKLHITDSEYKDKKLALVGKQETHKCPICEETRVFNTKKALKRHLLYEHKVK